MNSKREPHALCPTKLLKPPEAVPILRADFEKGSKKERMKDKPNLPSGYRPSDEEPFMNAKQREYFRRRLLAWKEELLKPSSETLRHLQTESLQEPDIADRATAETDRSVELRARDRERKLIAKIDAALKRIEDRTYGYCEETAEPIGLKRLMARPIATLSIEAQERHERIERTFKDE